jgi:hypothetical protein
LIEFGLLVLEKKIFKHFQCIFTLCYYLPLKKGYPLQLNKLESPPPKDDLCQLWLKLAKWFWRRSRKCKSLQKDKDRRRTTSDQKSSLELSAGELKMDRNVFNRFEAIIA